MEKKFDKVKVSDLLNREMSETEKKLEEKLDELLAKTERQACSLDIIYDADVKGEMLFYLEVAKELLYPQWVHVKEEDDELYIEVRSNTFIHNDRFSMIVEFTKEGVFKTGYYYVLDLDKKEETNQEKFKSDLILAIYQINKIHQALSEVKAPQ